MGLRQIFNDKVFRRGLIAGLAISAVASHAIYTKTQHVKDKNRESADDKHRESADDKYRESADRWVKAQDEAMKDAAKAAAYQAWLCALDDLQGKPLLEQVTAVNARVNALMTYAADQTFYHDSDYWAAPAESVFNKKGDCEDFAILKYESLRYLGVSDDQCGLLMMDTKNAKGEPSGHAVTMVDVSSERGYLCFLLMDLGEKIDDVSTLKPEEARPTRIINRSTSHPYPR